MSWTDLKFDRAAEQEYEGRLNERIANLSGGGVVIQVGAQTVIELKERKLRVEDALSAAEVEADIVKRALSYQLKLIAKDAGVNGSVVTEKVLSNHSPKYGNNAATGKYEDLIVAGRDDPTKIYGKGLMRKVHI